MITSEQIREVFHDLIGYNSHHDTIEALIDVVACAVACIDSEWRMDRCKQLEYAVDDLDELISPEFDDA